MASTPAQGPRHSRHRRAAASPTVRPAAQSSGRSAERNKPPAARLPVTELLFDRAGAASPFGDDQTFPLPVSELAYRHPGPAR